MSKIVRKGIFYALLFGALGFGLYQLNYREWARAQIITYFGAAGLQILDMKVDTLLPMGFEFTDIQVMAPSEFTVGMLRLNVIQRKLEALNIVVPKMFGEDAGIFNAELVFGFRDGKPVLEGAIKGVPNETNVLFTLYPVVGKPEDLRIHLKQGSMRWEQGTLSAGNVDFYPNKNVVTPITLQLQNIPLDSLVKQMLHPQAFATGNFSGELPLVYRSSTGISIAGVRLGNMQQGTLRLPEGIIPPSNEEMILLSDVLSNFNYTVLQMSSGQPDAQGRVPVVLTMEGNNPVHGTQPIKLNVNLGGDVLPFINSSLQLSQNPTGMIGNETSHH